MTAILATAAQLAQAVSGDLIAGDADTSCTSVSTDSRVPAPGALFVALRGENFDGARFAVSAVEQGATIVLIERSSLALKIAGELSAAVVAVDDTLRALGDLAAWHRRRLPARVVGITGSNGKTSTKQMTAAVLGGPPAVLSNRGNFNNLIGMPRALLGLGTGQTHAVVEMGMSARGEIARLAEIAAPEIGLITNVHPVHLEGLGSIEQVARAKAELIEALPADGVAVLNMDDPHVLKVASRTRARRVTFGRAPNADVRLLDSHETDAGVSFELSVAGEKIVSQLDRPGLHNAINAAAAAAVGWVENVAVAKIGERLARAELPALRMERLRLGSGYLLIDCYNANPRSMQAAIDTVVRLASGSACYAVLSDMRELGDASDELHQKLGHAAAASGLRGMCAFGRLARDIAAAAREGGLAEIMQTESLEEATDWVADKLRQDAWVLLKGSRAMRLERIADRLAVRFGVAWRKQED
ncbi:MAG TPA: UDP-N-acetylmuramoyl-tripeptide--D-alanyl-D-alanine ligase [Myxococcota bacterium]|nr:UDP-N-acetylmuramoyl-tripeptide--D-alanyl-D-alanine ligase [Myxococcota bacterium]